MAKICNVCSNIFFKLDNKECPLSQCYGDLNYIPARYSHLASEYGKKCFGFTTQKMLPDSHVLDPPRIVIAGDKPAARPVLLDLLQSENFNEGFEIDDGKRQMHIIESMLSRLSGPGFSWGIVVLNYKDLTTVQDKIVLESQLIAFLYRVISRFEMTD